MEQGACLGAPVTSRDGISNSSSDPDDTIRMSVCLIHRETMVPTLLSKTLMRGMSRNVISPDAQGVQPEIVAIGMRAEEHFLYVWERPTYKEYRREEWRRLFHSKSGRSAPLTEAEAERVRQLHRAGVGRQKLRSVWERRGFAFKFVWACDDIKQQCVAMRNHPKI